MRGLWPIVLSAGLCLCTPVSRAQTPTSPSAPDPHAPKITADSLRGILHIVGSSHQDIAWMDSPEKCIEQRDLAVITPALELLRAHPDYRYGMENTLNLVEYLERHPELREEIRRLTMEDRMEWGATYNQPYESLLSGEQLVRELYFGRKWIRTNLPGCDARVAWNPDVPGRSLQMQQILAKAGVPYLMISRHKENLFRWNSPDGSGVIAYTPGHYYNHSLILGDSIPIAARRIRERFTAWEEFYRARNMPAMMGMLNSQDAMGPQYFGKLAQYWNSLPVENGRALPLMKHSSAMEFFRSVDVSGGRLDTIVGERPNLWLYIHGPTHHWAIAAKRRAGVLLPAAEAFSTIDALLEGNYSRYPEKELATAWTASIYDDHGWGGNQGQVTDQLFRSKSDSAKAIGQRLLDRALGSIASRVQTGKTKGIPVLVFNALSWKRTDRVDVSLPRGSYRIVDAEGRPVPSQVSVPSGMPATETGTTVTFVARDVPSFGYTTYHAVVTPGPVARYDAASVAGTWDSRYYRIGFVPGGMQSIYDKELGQELLRTEKLLGAEIFTMRSVGTGAGEFTEVQQPTMDGFDKLSLHAPVWSKESEGPVYTCFSLTQPLQTCTIVQKVIVYHELKRIDLAVSILGWNGDRYREFRMALPLAMKSPEITYEVPMGVVRAGRDEMPGAAGYAYGNVDFTQPASQIRPREVQNFANVSDAGAGVTMSSDVAVMDFADPTDDPVAYPILQPILLASRRSCHGLGNWYLQEGDHHYRFSLFSHKPGWTAGYRQAIGSNNPLIAVIPHGNTAHGTLPVTQSFLSVSAENWIVTALKKCDDDENIILRLYDIEGKDASGAVQFAVPLARVRATSIIEDDGAEVPHTGSVIPLTIGHHAIETYKLHPATPMKACAAAPVITRDALGVVTITSATAGAEIRYTLDGTEPSASALPYTAGFSRVAASVVQAKAFGNGLASSDVVEARFETLAAPAVQGPARSMNVVELPFTVPLSSPSGGTIRYTLDGSVPSASSPVYSTPIPITAACVLSARVYQEGYRPGPVRSWTLRVVRPGGGLSYKYYEGSGWSRLPGFAGLTPVREGAVDRFDISVIKSREDQWGVDFTGTLTVEYAGNYWFHILSDDGARLLIDGMVVVDNDGSHSATEKSGAVSLSAGAHVIELLYFDDSEGEALRVLYEGPGVHRQAVPASVLARPVQK
jgi:alpha-mannosidase